MTSPNFIDSWFQMLSAAAGKPIAVNLPGSGSIGGFNYQPYTTWEAPSLYRGNIALEQSIYSGVASPGKQLGKLTDVVLKLAAILKDDVEKYKDAATKVAELEKIASLIEDLKKPVIETAEQNARDDLDKLLGLNKKTLRAVIDDFDRKLKEDKS
jgi:hypothetical protein